MVINETYLSLGGYKDVGYDHMMGKDVMRDVQGREFRVPSASFHPFWRTQTLLVREFITNDNIEVVLVVPADGVFYETFVTVTRTDNVRALTGGNSPWDLTQLYQEGGRWYATRGRDTDRYAVKPYFVTGAAAREVRRLMAWVTIITMTQRGVVFDDTLGTTIWHKTDGSYEIRTEGAGPAVVYGDVLTALGTFLRKIESLFGYPNKEGSDA